MTLVTTTAPGQPFAPVEQSQQFFTYLSAQSVALASGVRVIRTNRVALDIPRVNADVSANWTLEATEITPSDPSADLIVATPKKLAALTFVSNELVEDSNPDVLNMIAEGLARSMSLKLDLGFFQGSGTAPEVRGLKNTSGISTISMGTNGAAVSSLDPLLDAFAALTSANAEPSAIYMHPRTWAALTKIKAVSGGQAPVLADPTTGPTGAIQRSIMGVPAYLSSQLPTTESQGSASAASSIYVVEAEELVVVLRDDVKTVVDTSYKFSSDSVAVRATMRADVVVPFPGAVCRITGVL